MAGARLGIVVAGFLVMAAAALFGAASASAHAVVVSSDPTDGARLAKAPTSVTIRFDEAVGLDVGYLRVVDSAGQRVDVGKASHPGGNGAVVTVALKPGLSDGSYLASYRVVSADSHPVGGAIRFVVGNGPLVSVIGSSGSAGSVDRAVSSSLATAHWLSFTGIALVGGSWLIFSVWPSGRRRRRIRQAIWTGWTLAAVGALAEFLLQGPYAAGSRIGTMFQSTLLDATLHVNSGQLLSVRLILLGVLGAVLTALLGTNLARRPSWGPEAGAMVGVGIIVTFAASGHAQALSPRWFSVLVDSLHLTAMVVWLGGLAILLVASLRRRSVAVAATNEYIERIDREGADIERAEHDDEHFDEVFDEDVDKYVDEDVDEYVDEYVDQDYPDDDDGGPDDATELAAALPIFSRVALTCVAVLAVTGTIQAWREVGTIDALPSTLYGQLVIVKVALLAVVIGLGYLARRTVLRRDWAMASGPLPRMRRTIAVEVVVGAVILAVSAVLISQPPGKVALDAQRSKAKSTVVAVSTNATARVGVNPGKHGAVTIDVQLAGVTATNVTATAALPAKSLGPIPVPLQVAGPGHYTASGVLLPSSGDWQIDLTIQTSEFNSTAVVAQLQLS
jgi:copper transport protein